MKKIIIDLDKAKIAFTPNDIDIIKKCEIKPEQKQNELKNLFFGAPVMAKLQQSKTYVLQIWERDDRVQASDRHFHRIGSDECDSIRLPTVEEAPRNVWLAPWLKRPEELKNNNVYYKFFSNPKVQQEETINVFGWNAVEAIMIMGDFKK